MKRLTFCPACGSFIPATLNACACGQSAFEAEAPPTPAPLPPADDATAAPLPAAMFAPAPVPAYVGAAPAAAVPMVPSVTPAMAAADRGTPNRLPMFIIATVLVVTAIVGGVFYYQRTMSFSARITRAVEENRIFSPAGDCAVDIFAAKYARERNAADVQQAAAAIRAKLEPLGEEAFRKWYIDSDGVDWDFTEKSYAFLADITGDTKVRARHEYAAGQIALQNQNHSRALAHYSEALRLDPSSVLALNGLAKVYIQDSSPLHNESAAVTYYQRAASLDPNFTWAFKNLGEYYMRMEDWHMAEDYMLKALATSPSRPSILRSLARIYYNQRDYDRALEYNQRYIAVASDPEGITKAQAAIAQIHQDMARRGR